VQCNFGVTLLDVATRFNILSLDGGGLKGVYSAAFMAALEEDHGVRIQDHVDLIAGTSTGGILAIGLGHDLRPAELLDIYCSRADTIFSRRRVRPGLTRPRYRPGGLATVLREILGERRFGESKVRLVIPTYDLDNNCVYVFRTPHTERLKRDWRESSVDVALATSAAPTFFPAHGLRGSRLIDGGVWANNPSMVAVAEAVNSCGRTLDDLHLLSIGTSTEVRNASKLPRAGLVRWARPLVQTVLDGQAHAAKNQCFLLLGDNRFVRADPMVPAGLVALDRLDPADLISRARSDSRHLGPRVERFLDHRAIPFRPIYPPAEGGQRANADH
jgi:predicted acylesterase/phospholipase RssA